MTTITLNINEKSKMGKAFLNFLNNFRLATSEIEIVENANIYGEKFVDKIKKSRKQIKEGKTIPVETESLWESIK